MKFTLRKTPVRVLWAEVHHLQMETDGKDGKELIKDTDTIEALDEIFRANLIKEFDGNQKGKTYDSEEEGRLFKC